MGESKITARIGLFVLCWVLLDLLFCCRPKETRTPPMHEAGVPRVSPAYVQWLTQQSMLGKSQELIATVSGTNHVLQNSGTEERYALLLQEAPTWLDINPHVSALPTPIFSSLANDKFQKTLTTFSIQGLYIAPTGETAEIWSNKRSTDPTGSDVTGFAFSPAAGDEQSFTRLRNSSACQLGGALPPAATGMGPDFFLQTRGLQQYTGLYTAVELPKDVWTSLPKLAHEGDIAKLPEQAFRDLVARGLLPEHFHRNNLSWTSPFGWAVTGEILGVDGNIRRFAYCYDTQIDRPILFWQDPSGLAKRLYAAACIRHTGLAQQTLTGLPIKPLMGLDPRRHGEHGTTTTSSLEPGLSALADLAHTVHRFGGWCVTEEIFPPEVLSNMLANVDFVNDGLVPNAIEQAVRTEDTAQITAALAAYQAHRIPQNRLAHGLAAWQFPKLKETKLSPHDTVLALALPIALPGLCFLPDELFTTCLESAYAETLRALFDARKRLRPAMGELVWKKTPQQKGCIALLNRLPGGEIWLVAANFSHTPKDVVLDLPKRENAKLFDLVQQKELHMMTNGGGQRILHLQPREARHVLLGGVLR